MWAQRELPARKTALPRGGAASWGTIFHCIPRALDMIWAHRGHERQQEPAVKGLPCTGRLGQVSESGFAEQQLIREGGQGRSNPPTPAGLDAQEQHVAIHLLVLTRPR